MDFASQASFPKQLSAIGKKSCVLSSRWHQGWQRADAEGKSSLRCISAQGKPQASVVSGQPWEAGEGNCSLKGDIWFGTTDLFLSTSCNPDTIFHIARCFQLCSQCAQNRDAGLIAIGLLQGAVPQF